MAVHLHVSNSRGHAAAPTDEHLGALKLKRLFEQEWGGGHPFPDADARVHIFVQPRMRGRGNDSEEPDLFVAIECSPVFAGIISRNHDIPLVLSMFIVIELKSHSQGVLFFENGEVEVPYNGDYSNATRQNKRQCDSALGFIRDRLRHRNIPGMPPWLSRALWLDGYSSHSYPHQGIEHRLVFCDLTIAELVRRAGMGASCIEQRQGYTLYKASQVPGMCDILVDCISVPQNPTILDRRRMDAILTRALGDQGAGDGSGGVIFSGYGGTGKTFALLSSAIRQYKNRNRVLVLTFNLVLAFELRRMVSMMDLDGRRIPSSDAGAPCVGVQTLSSWVKALAVSLGLATPGADLFPANDPGYYQGLCEGILREIGDIADPVKMKHRLGEAAQFDAVFIDEAQDVPSHEKALVLAVFGTKFWVSDGRDQCFRAIQDTDWRRDLGGNIRGEVQVQDLQACYRLQSNLCAFVNRFAMAIGLDGFSLVPHGQAAGGRVIVHSGQPEQALRDSFPLAFMENKAAGNSPIDMLVCADSGLFGSGNAIKQNLLDRNCKVWDGTLREEDLDQMNEDEVRLVFLDHCRGLEGFMVFLLGLDTFYERHLAHLERELAHVPSAPDRRRAAEAAAKKFMTIPLTRAMNTLVIQVNNRNSTIGRILCGLHGDYIEHR